MAWKRGGTDAGRLDDDIPALCPRRAGAVLFGVVLPTERAAVAGRHHHEHGIRLRFTGTTQPRRDAITIVRRSDPDGRDLWQTMFFEPLVTDESQPRCPGVFKPPWN